MRKISGVFAAVALLASAVCPVTVSACPMETAKVKPCCCCKAERQPEAPRHCPCKKPTGELPGSPCVIQKTLPSGTMPSAAAPGFEGSHLAILLPEALTFPAPPSEVSFLCHRIEPGWDPGNFGLILSLRL